MLKIHATDTFEAFYICEIIILVNIVKNEMLKKRRSTLYIVTISVKIGCQINKNIQFCVLRLCKTWLWSLSAILPLFWCHDIAKLHRLCREDFRTVLWRHEICDIFPRIMTCALQNMQFSQYFTMKFNIFSLNLTGESDFFILFISTHNKISMSGFW